MVCSFSFNRLPYTSVINLIPTHDQIITVIQMLEDSGLNEKDRERVLEMVMEVSGARGTVENAMKVSELLTNLIVPYTYQAILQGLISTGTRAPKFIWSWERGDERQRKGNSLFIMNFCKALNTGCNLRPKVGSSLVNKLSAISVYE